MRSVLGSGGGIKKGCLFSDNLFLYIL
jgi:hypothetical protein